MNRERLIKMAGAVRTGGKGTMRRKKKTVHKTTTTDDKRLQSTLKRIGVKAIPAIEEVNIFKDDTVIHFINPKGVSNHSPRNWVSTITCLSMFLPVQASIAANTWVVSGSPQTKKLQDLLPGIINQLGPDSFVNLQKIAQQLQKKGAGPAVVENDDDVPDLVEGETFEEASKKEPSS